MGYDIDNGAISQEDEFIGHGDYACMIHMSELEKEVAELRKDNHEIPTLKNRICNLLQGIEGYEGNNNRYHAIVAKLLNYDKSDISIHHAKGMLEDLRPPVQVQLEKEVEALKATLSVIVEKIGDANYHGERSYPACMNYIEHLAKSKLEGGE